ncbi:MAG: MATE family efflux transporter [Lachnospiraceae bacterium]|nr:MATE family efflux transporter [Lachnospiraceae bacterium]
MDGVTNVRDLTAGPVARKLYRFALPIICTNLLQAVYNVVDMVIVGRFLGSAGITAVNVGGQVVMIVFVIISAYSNAEAVVVGQLTGAGRKKDIPAAVNTTLIFSLVMAAVLMMGVITLSTPLLTALNVPEEAFDGAKSYLVVYMCGTFFVYIYNALYGLLRGIGESTAPMVFAIVSTGVNIALDVLFVAVLSLGTGGAALATVLSQALSMTLMIVFVLKRVSVYQFLLKEFRIARHWLKETLKVGFPQMCQFVLTNISFLLLSALINRYGVQAAAAAGATNKIYTFAVLPAQAMMAAIVTLTAQNLPGKDYRRILRGLGYGILLATLIAAAVWILCELFPGQLLGVFTTEAGVIEVGIPFMRIFICCILIENVMFCVNGLLTGSGYTHITMIGALIAAFVVRYALAWVLSQRTAMGFNGIALSYVFAPCATLGIGGVFALTGRWKRPRVKM